MIHRFFLSLKFVCFTGLNASKLYMQVCIFPCRKAYSNEEPECITAKPLMVYCINIQVLGSGLTSSAIFQQKTPRQNQKDHNVCLCMGNSLGQSAVQVHIQQYK